MKLINLITLLLVFAQTSCLTSTSANYGINPAYKVDVPAQTLIMPCSIWPKEHQSNLSSFERAVSIDEFNDICQKFDEEILTGYKDQPYMRGLSPKLVSSILTKNPKLQNWHSHWSPPKVSSQFGKKLSLDLVNNIENAKQYYQKYIEHQLVWRNWLNSMRGASRQSDSMLIPLVVEASSKKTEDRGLPTWKKQLSLLLLLVDTSNGDLIWSGRSKSSASTSKLPTENIELAEPKWEDLYAKVFTRALWREFPGKRFSFNK